MRGGIKKVYTIYLTVLLVLSALVLILLWVSLARFQSNAVEEEPSVTVEAAVPVDERALQTAFEEYMGRTGPSWWSDHLMASREADGEPLLDTPRQVRAFFDDLFAEYDVQLFKADNWSAQKPVYRARIGDHGEATAQITMTGAGDVWEVDQVHVSARGNRTGSIEAPEGAEVICGRTNLDETYKTGGESVRFPFAEYQEVLKNPVVWQEYQVSGLLGEPSLSVAESGDIVWSEPDDCAVVLVRGEEKDPFLERAESFLKTYLHLTTAGKEGFSGYYSTCIGMVRKDSTAYGLLSDARASIAYSMTYSDLSVEIIEADRVIRWADNAYTAEIVYHAYARYGGVQKDYSGEDQHFRVLFLDQGDGWEICGFQTE